MTSNIKEKCLARITLRKEVQPGDLEMKEALTEKRSQDTHA